MSGRPIAKRILAKMKLQSQRRVVNIKNVITGRRIGEELQQAVVSQKDLAGFRPAHAAYVRTHERILERLRVRGLREPPFGRDLCRRFSGCSREPDRQGLLLRLAVCDRRAVFTLKGSIGSPCEPIRGRSGPGRASFSIFPSASDPARKVPYRRCEWLVASRRGLRPGPAPLRGASP